jgi:succinate dehydrogenase/fumarate reductase flavoprotein subunit
VIDELQRDDAGAVLRLALRHVRRGEAKAVRVRRGVVLAAGDFSANDELARAHGRPPEVSAVEPIQPNATGDCLLLAMAIGAEAVGLDRGGGAGFRTVLAPYVAPDGGLLREGAMLVNKLGRRFGNELERWEIALAANDQPDHHAYIIFDARVAARIATAEEDHPPSRDGWFRNDKLFLGTFPGVAYAYIEDFRGTDYFYEGGTIRELADRAGLPVDALAEEAEQFSAAAKAGAGDRFGRDPIGPGVSEPPFYAVGPIHPIITFSAGGLRVDAAMHVLDGDGRPIPHLYSCGANAEALVFLGGHGHHLAWAFGTGRIAGTNAAAERPVE